MKFKFYNLALAGFLLLLFCLPAFADKVKLTNGNTMEGEVISTAGEEVVLQIPGGKVTLKKNEVVHIEKTPLSASQNYTPQFKEAASSSAEFLSQLTVKKKGSPSRGVEFKNYFPQTQKNSQSSLQWQDLPKQLMSGFFKNALTLPFILTLLMKILLQALYGGLVVKIYMKVIRKFVPYLYAVKYMFITQLIAGLAFLLIVVSVFVVLGMSSRPILSFILCAVCLLGIIVEWIVVYLRVTRRMLGLNFLGVLGMVVFSVFVGWVTGIVVGILLAIVAPLFGGLKAIS